MPNAVKILLIWDRAGHYHIARWKALQGQLNAEDVHLANLGGSDSLYQWESASGEYFHQLSEKSVDTPDALTRIKNYWRLIRKEKFTHIAIPGYGRLEYLIFLLIARFTYKKVILFAESWYPGNTVLDQFKSIYLKWTVDWFFVSGKRAKMHFQHALKIHEKKIKTGYSVVDNAHFAKQQPAPLTAPYILSVARYSTEKNLPLLIEAFRKSRLFSTHQLILIGDGPQKENLRALIGDDHDKIHLTGWKSYDELPAWYQYADCFVLASSFEPWGLVVNEALAAETLTFASKVCGCVDDLLSDSDFVFEETDIDALVNRLNNLDQYHVPPIKIDCQSWSQQLLSML